MNTYRRGHGRWWMKVPLVLAMVIIAGGLFGWIVASLWNWLMPALFGLRAITFWEALGLLVLARILFGGFTRHGRSRRHGLHERWKRMTPEERESFSRGLRQGCPWHRRSGDTTDRGAAPSEPGSGP